MSRASACSWRPDAWALLFAERAAANLGRPGHPAKSRVDDRAAKMSPAFGSAMNHLRQLPCLLSLAAMTGCQTGCQKDGGSARGGTGGSAPGNGGAGGTTACATTSAAALRGCVSQDRYLADLTLIAQARPPGSAQWQTVQDLCATRFEALGYRVERQSYGTGVNVIGTRGGAGAAPAVVVSAHYDSVSDCPSADDNASGVAGVLEVARVLGGANLGGTLIVACWDEEEQGYLGSEAYVARAAAASATITAAFVFEMIGYFSQQAGSQTLPAGFGALFPQAAASVTTNGNRGDFIAVIADPSAVPAAQSFVLHAGSIGLFALELDVPASLKSSSLIADLRRSDHASFWDAGYPALMITDTSEFRNSHYHCQGGPDVVGDLDHRFATQVLAATVGAAAGLLGL
jgi:hypothetical protein